MELDDLTWFFALGTKLKKYNSCFINTIDNPGFSLDIDLQNTEYQNKPFSMVSINRSEHDWIDCFLENGKFKGRCGPTNLHEVLAIFRSWIEDNEIKITNPSLSNIIDWYVKQCDGNWEHGNGLEIRLVSMSRCQLQIDLAETECEGEDFSILNTADCLMQYYVAQQKFHAEFDLNVLTDAIDIFLRWANQFTIKYENFYVCDKIISPGKINMLIDVLMGRNVLNVICFQNYVHFVFHDGIYLNIYAKIIQMEVDRITRGKITKIILSDPFLTLKINNYQCLNIDLRYTFDGGAVRLELHTFQKYASMGPEWTEDRFDKESLVLFV